MSESSPSVGDPELLARCLAGHDIPCPVCGYNLRGLESSTCPECSARLDLRVGSIDLKLKPLVVALVGSALPLGFVASTGVRPIFELLRGDRLRPGEWLTAAYCWTATLLFGFVVWQLMERRKIFLKNRPSLQWKLAAASIALGTALATGLVALLVLVV